MCFFDPDDSDLFFGPLADGKPYSKLVFLIYTCRHCMRTRKIFALYLGKDVGHQGS